MVSKELIKKLLLPIVASLVVFFLMNQNAFLYKIPVAKIMSVQSSSPKKMVDDYQNSDEQVQQKIVLRLKNQTHGKLTVENIALKSQVMTQLYRVGQVVLLKKTSTGYQIDTLKRDALIAALFTLFSGFLIAFIRWQKFIFLISCMALNLLLFVLAVIFDVHFNFKIIVLFSTLVVLFTVLSLRLVLGRSRQMVYTAISTLLTLLVTFSLAYLVLYLTHSQGVFVENTEYISQAPSDLFFMGTIISVLGAVMDGAGDIVVGLFGLQRQNELNQLNLHFSDFWKSGRANGEEIVGTLINVLLMIFMAELLPFTLLLLKNGDGWGEVGFLALNLGLLQSVICAIGIVLSVPISTLLVAAGLMRRERK